MRAALAVLALAVSTLLMWNTAAEADDSTAAAVFFGGMVVLILCGYGIRAYWALALPLASLFALEVVGLSYEAGPGFWGEAWPWTLFFVAVLCVTALGVGQLAGSRRAARRRRP